MLRLNGEIIGQLEVMEIIASGIGNIQLTQKYLFLKIES